VDSVVAHLALNSGWAGEVWDFGEKAVDRCAVTDGFHTWNMCTGCFGWGKQRSDLVQQMAVPAVHQEAEMREEVDADERLSNVGHYESPREIPA
jgi:hypothetical protein